MRGLQLNGRAIAIGILVLLVLIVVGSQLLGGQGNREEQLTPTLAPFAEDSAPAVGVVLGRLVTSSGIDADGCPTNPTDQFASTDEIYVVVEDSDIPAGTTVFARLFRDGQPVEDADPITADRDYTNTCIYFVFSVTDQAIRLDPGTYEAQVIVNGNPGERVGFEVR